MAVMLVVAALGGLTGLLTRDRAAPRRSWRLRAWPLLVAAVAGQALIGGLPPAARGALAAADCLAVAAWAGVNRRRRSGLRGPLPLAIGCALNAVVVAANHGMPVSRWALRNAGLPASMDVARGHLEKHVVMSGHSRLAFLGDIIPFRLAHMVLSVGDVLMLVGIGLTTWSLSHPDRSVIKEVNSSGSAASTADRETGPLSASQGSRA